VTASDEPVRVYVIDRAGPEANAFGAKLTGREGVELAGGSDDVREALDEIDETEPDLVLIGTDLGGKGCVSAVESVLAVHPQAAVVMLSTVDDKPLVAAAIRAGSVGAVDRTASPGETITALHVYQLHRSGKPVDLALAEPPGEVRGLRVSGALPVFPGAEGAPEPGVEATTLTAATRTRRTEDRAATPEDPAESTTPADAPSQDVAGLRANLAEQPAAPRKRGFKLFGRKGGKEKDWGPSSGKEKAGKDKHA
jgi:chemotaxis response regulator CheB